MFNIKWKTLDKNIAETIPVDYNTKNGKVTDIKEVDIYLDREKISTLGDIESYAFIFSNEAGHATDIALHWMEYDPPSMLEEAIVTQFQYEYGKQIGYVPPWQLFCISDMQKAYTLIKKTQQINTKLAQGAELKRQLYDVYWGTTYWGDDRMNPNSSLWYEDFQYWIRMSSLRITLEKAFE